MDGAANVLEAGHADHARAARGRIDLDVGDAGGVAALGADRVELRTGADRAAGLRRLGRDPRERQRLELAGIVAGRPGIAVVPR